MIFPSEKITQLAYITLKTSGSKSNIKLIPYEEFYGPHYEDLKR